jgi:Armadillo/beta-catenin-like repeat
MVAENKVSIVSLGGLPPLIRQMMSPNVEVQCNAVGCITNLATHEDNKAKIARSGALSPLTRLAKSKDMRVQRNATGALLNMTHSGKHPKHARGGRILLTRPQMTTGSNSSMLVRSQCLFSSSLRQTWMYNTTAQPP